ncbi:hypothetical protein Sjap_020788 [Stephania japonica]|uniref:Uncharacterized protein n=1 Tax=Stephania japonica TaxID=461633 RepID=A0AAP0F275_9MAGN
MLEHNKNSELSIEFYCWKLVLDMKISSSRSEESNTKHNLQPRNLRVGLGVGNISLGIGRLGNS